MDIINTFAVSKLFGLVFRHALTVAGGYMVAEGYADETTVNEIAGGFIALSGVILSIIEKRNRSGSDRQ